MMTSQVTSDPQGKINFDVNHEVHQIGIFGKNDPADISCVSYLVNDSTLFLEHHKACNLKIRLLNRGGKTAKGLRVTLSTTTADVTILNPAIEFSSLGSGELQWITPEFRIRADNKPTTNGAPFQSPLSMLQ